MNKVKIYNYISRFKIVLSICISLCLWQIAFVVYNYDLYVKYNSMPIACKVILEIIVTWGLVDVYKYLKPKYMRFTDSKYFIEKKKLFKWLFVNSAKQIWMVGKFFLKWGFIIICIIQPIWLIIKYYLF